MKDKYLYFNNKYNLEFVLIFLNYFKNNNIISDDVYTNFSNKIINKIDRLK